MEEQPATRTAPRVSICVPCHDQVAAGFTNDLTALVGWSTLNLVAEGHLDNLQLNFLSGTLVHHARQRLVEAALQYDPDYVLWVDADMRFPPDALHQLLKHRQPVVGINYPTRSMPPRWVASKKVRWAEDEVRVPCVTDEDSEGLERVEGMGLGLALIRSDVLAALPIPRGENLPWFWYDYQPEIDAHMGEDVYFCRKIREAGFDILVDHDLSKRCAHVGTFEYRPAHVQAIEEAIDGPDHE